MFLAITTTHQPATDLGFLLHKNPARLNTVDVPCGRAHVFYPEASPERCTAVMLVEVDPVGLVRGRPGSGPGSGTLDHYVNELPYAATSLMCVALTHVFGTAMGGRSKERQELADTPIPLEAHLPALTVKGGEDVLRTMFEPLGYAVDVVRHPLDPAFPAWGDGSCWSLTLRGTCRIGDLLRQLYVLIPVLGASKHYFMDGAEVDKLLGKGGDWLKEHPARDAIVKRYLRRRPRLIREAFERLTADEGCDEDEVAEKKTEAEANLEHALGLGERRVEAVAAAILEVNPARAADLGCGEGRLLQRLMRERAVAQIVGMDVSLRSLDVAESRLKLDRLPDRQRERIRLVQGSLMYRDERLAGFDAAAVAEVVEHLDPPRLTAFERVVFGCARPGRVVLTTPNREYNAMWPTLAPGALRHGDHRFEWARAEFRDWARGVAASNGYTVEFRAVGDEDAKLGPPTQMAVFDR